ncbi:MAG: C69 family dipeptidase [Acidimicrobiia bacterium]
MCDTLCVIGAGRSLFAKNSDRPRDEMQLLEAHPPRASGGTLRTTHAELDDAGALAVVGSRPAWMWGFEHGLNEHRVAIGNERIFTVDDPHDAPPSLTGMDLVRLGLERGRSADEAVDVMTSLLERHGQGGPCTEAEDDPYWSSFLAADPDGAWVLETSGRTWVARRVDDGAAISNRVTLGSDWTRSSSEVRAGDDFSRRLDPTVPTEPSDVRLAATRSCVATGAAALGPRDLVATMRHHGQRSWGAPGSAPDDVDPPPPTDAPGWGGFTVCWHIRTVQATTASMVAELSADADVPLRAWFALGSPCTSVYLPTFPPSVAEPLAETETWHRFARLRDRVEENGTVLAEIRAVLAPLETALWEEADEAAPDPKERSTFAARAWPAVDAALTRLGV